MARGRNERPVIVKKVMVIENHQGGGAWKVAYADFVTAMMAFFLLLWLLNSTDEDQRKGLADYFAPTLVKTKETAGSVSLLGGSSVSTDNYPQNGGQVGTEALTPPREPMARTRENIEMMARIRTRLEAKLTSSERLKRLVQQVRMVETTEGMRIDLVDDADFAMFALGTTVLTNDATELIAVLAESLRREKGRLTIRGHTDALPWRSELAGNNWALSAGRADATRQALISNGIVATRFLRIEGVAERELLIKSNPHDPRNRRISIVIDR